MRTFCISLARVTTPTSAEPALRSGGFRLGRREWLTIAAMGGFIALLNIVGWGLLIGVVAPARYDLGAAGVFGIGLGVTAFTLGMRHAFDADHIAAIDNTTRKLMAEGQTPVSVGFWFALGHASVVFALVLLLSLGVRALVGQVADASSTLQTFFGFVGTAVSGFFLLAIGLINLVILLRILRLFRGVRSGEVDEATLDAHLDSRGFLARILRGVSKAIRRPRDMYPLGVLFGLGFDTATEIALLVLAGGAAALALPWYAILVLPVLFAAGMTLLDTIDGAFMNVAYGWAFAHPMRKLFYNIVVTALSVFVALVIGLIEILSLVAVEAGASSGPLAWVASINLDDIGFVIVGVFVVTWAVAVVAWKVGGFDRRWTPGSATAE